MSPPAKKRKLSTPSTDVNIIITTLNSIQEDLKKGKQSHILIVRYILISFYIFQISMTQKKKIDSLQGNIVEIKDATLKNKKCIII